MQCARRPAASKSPKNAKMPMCYFRRSPATTFDCQTRGQGCVLSKVVEAGPISLLGQTLPKSNVRVTSVHASISDMFLRQSARLAARSSALGWQCRVLASAPRKFADDFAVYHAAAFAIWVQPLGFDSVEAIFHDKWVTCVRSPLLMKWHDTLATALANNITHPLWVRVTGTCATLAARYQPVR